MTQVLRVHRDRALDRAPELLALYRAAFAGPPWHADSEDPAARTGVLQRHLGEAAVEVAWALEGSGIVGVTYGWPSGPPTCDGDLRDRVRQVLQDDAATYLSPHCFELAELAVHPDHQGRGLGRRLLEEVVGERPGWLLTHPQGSGAQLYEHLGWRDAGGLTTPDGHVLRVHVHPGRAGAQPVTAGPGRGAAPALLRP